MGSVNKVILVGNLGSDPELKYTPSNRPVCNLSVATNEVWKDKQGQKQEKTEWHRVNVWGDQAEHCSKYLAKGRMVYIEGKLQTRKWEDKEGRPRYTTEVIADRVVFLGGGNGDSASGSPRGEQTGWGAGQRGAGQHRDVNASDPPAVPPGFGDDDIPF